jgi:hypothetical protein
MHIKRGIAPDEYHHRRMLRTIYNYDYDRGHPSIRRAELSPYKLLTMLAIFEAMNEPVQWAKLGPFSPERLVRHLHDLQAERSRQRARLESHVAVELIPAWAWRRIGSVEELTGRIELMEEHGAPFHPIYLDRVTDKSRQKLLESLVFLQFMHVILRLYGFKNAADRNMIIGRKRDALLTGGADACT